MRIAILNSLQSTFNQTLAKEIGLEASVVLLTLEQEIAEKGMDKDGMRMVARDAKQVAALFPWMGQAQTRKALESLRDRDFIYILDVTLFTKDSNKWYSMNWAKLKTLESIVVLGDGDIEEMHEAAPKVLPEEPVKANGNGMPQLHSSLFPVVIKMSNLTTPLTPRDAGEVGQFIKRIVAKYPDEDFERLQKRILGIRVWQESRTSGGEHFTAPRPMTAWSNYERYAQYCREKHQGNLPPIPAEWIEETGRRHS